MTNGSTDDTEYPDQDQDILVRDTPTAVAIILSTLLIGLVLSLRFDLGLVPAISTLGSLTLSGLLIMMYNIQNQTQETQTEIMENQEKLMEAEHKPIIDIDSFYPYASPHLQPDRTDKNAVRLSVKNVGNGTAIRAGFFVEIDSKDDQGDGRMHIQGLTPEPGDDDESSRFEALSASIPPNGRLRSFGAPVYAVSINEDDYRYKLFPKVLNEYYENGIYDLQVRFGVAVQNIVDETFDFEIGLMKINLLEMISESRSEDKELKSNDYTISNPEEAFSFYEVFQYSINDYGLGTIGPTDENVDPDVSGIEWSNKMPLISYNTLTEALEKKKLENDKE